MLRDSKTGRPINGYGYLSDEEEEEAESIGLRELSLFCYLLGKWLLMRCVHGLYIAGYSFFDAGDVELLGQRKRSAHSDVGMFEKLLWGLWECGN